MTSLLIAIATLTATPAAPSALDHAVRKPAAAVVAPAPKVLAPSPGCTVRDLVQGSGKVKICG